MSKRAHISLKTKLASALLALEDYQADPVTGKTRRMRLIPYTDAQLMTSDQIISLFAFDHYPQRKADGGSDEPWNLEPRLIRAHRAKTAKVDVPEMAKSKRIRRKEEEHHGRIRLIKFEEWAKPAKPKRRIPSRPFPPGKRKLRSK